MLKVRKREPKVKTLICEHCGKEFSGFSGGGVRLRRKTCSDSCAGALAIAKGKANGNIESELEPTRRGLPTNSLAGSVERVEVYRQRLERGEDLFHPLDNPLVQLEEYRKGYRVPKFTVSVSMSRAQMEAERVRTQ